MTLLLLSMVTATPDGGFTEPPEPIVRSPVWEVACGVVTAELMVVWAKDWLAQTSAVRLTSGGPNRRILAQRRAPGAALAAFGEKYPVIKAYPLRRTDRSSTIVSCE
jgi:hypothetical protein